METIYAVKIIREACDGVYDSRKNAVVRNTGSLPESRITRTKQVRAPPSSRYNDVCDPASCQRDHEIERPSRVAVAADGERSHVVRIPALQSLRDWFAARYSGFVLLVQYPRWGPAPDISLPARAAHSLPSEITAVALTAFSHVPVARVTLVVLVTRERERD